MSTDRARPVATAHPDADQPGQAPESRFGAHRPSRIRWPLLLAATLMLSACEDWGPQTEYANRTPEGDWNVHLADGTFCLVTASQASSVENALQICRERQSSRR